MQPLTPITPAFTEVVVLGCGNVLFGDDGFGPHVARHLQNLDLDENISIVNAGTSVRKILFNMVLSDERPRKIVIVDALDINAEPGMIFRMNINQLPKNKIDHLSFHQLPTSNLLRELKEHCGVEVVIVAAQIESIPEVVQPGLSDTLARKVTAAAQEVLDSIAS